MLQVSQFAQLLFKAMIQINLLPIREIKRRKRAKNELLLAALAVVLFLAVLALMIIAYTMQTKRLQHDLEDLQAKRRQYETQLKEIEALEKEKKRLQTRIEIIQNLKKKSGIAVHVLDDIANRTPPDRIWLTKLAQTGTALDMTGMAQDNQTVAKYMLDLEESPYLAGISLGSSKMSKYADRDLMQFVLKSSITVPDPAQSSSSKAQ